MMRIAAFLCLSAGCTATTDEAVGLLQAQQETQSYKLMASLISEAVLICDKAHEVVAENRKLVVASLKTVQHDMLVTDAAAEKEKEAASTLQAQLAKSNDEQDLQELEASSANLAHDHGAFTLASADFLQNVWEVVGKINLHTNGALASLTSATATFKQCATEAAVTVNSIGDAMHSLLQAESSLGAIQSMPLVELGAADLTTKQQQQLGSRLQKMIDFNHEVIDTVAKGNQCCLNFCDQQESVSAAAAMCRLFRSKLISLA